MYNVHVDVTHCTDHANAHIYNILFLINRVMLKMEKHKKCENESRYDRRSYR